jgi:hypothetical protein
MEQPALEALFAEPLKAGRRSSRVLLSVYEVAKGAAGRASSHNHGT